MFGLDMSLWNRVQYPSRKSVAFSVRDTLGVSIGIGFCSLLVVSIASKIVATTVGVF
jgi:hypothetical protein